MPKTTKLITVPEQNEHFKGAEFKRWDSMLARFLQDRPDREVKPSANKKNKGKRKQ